MQTTSESDQAVDELGDAVVALVRAWRGVSRHVIGGSQTTLAVLEMARTIGEGERRLSEIAELRGVDQSVISRQIGELQRKNLVCRRPDPLDGRASLVRLTPAGLEVLETACRARLEWLRGALSRSPTADVRTTARLVAALSEELEAHAADLEGLLTHNETVAITS
ncbi:MarR family transcriptional regulator [Actinomycetes bacterium KLBMP 9759]